MHTKLAVLFALVCTVVGRDISIGSTSGRRIFDEVRQASPAIWRQIENVTIIAPSYEIISGVVITDMRPEKDGDAEIVDGGEGKDRVTVELKSPTVLRGYEFHLAVYTIPSTKYSDGEENLPVSSSDSSKQPENNESTTSESASSGDHSSSEIPEENVTDLPENSDKDVPSLIGKDLNESIRPARETYEGSVLQTTESRYSSEATETSEEKLTTEIPEIHGKDTPTLIGFDLNKNIRPSRYINDKDDENVSETTKSAPVTSTPDNAATTLAEERTTTELPEQSDENVPTVIGKDIGEITRPARGTNHENNSSLLDSESIANVPSVLAGDANTTQSTDREHTTTEINMETTDDEEITSVPVMLDNSKNIPDFASLDILDMIKEKEGTRRIRHTEEVNNKYTETDNHENSQNYEPSVRSNGDETVDLMPPELDASYNTDFADKQKSDSSSTESSEDSTGNGGIEEKISTTEITVLEQLRDARHAESVNANEDSNNVENPKESQESMSCGSSLSNRNTIVLNGDVLTENDGKLRYETPIVLILANSNYPSIKIIVEGSPSENKPVIENSMGENTEVNDETPKIVDDIDLAPPTGDYDPKPVKEFEN